MGDLKRAWLEERQAGIGGSDAAAIIGKSPYMTNVKLWEIKTGLTKQTDISEKECVRYGVKAETHLRELFKLDYPQFEVENEEYKTVQNETYPFIRGSFDGVITDKTSGKTGVLEIKTTTIRRGRDLDKWENQIPQNYYCQLLHYFLCREDFEFAILKAKLLMPFFNREENEIFHIIPTQIRHYFISKEQVLSDLEYLLEEEKEFWGYVERNERPPLKLPNI